jgi:hypothetical protein
MEFPSQWESGPLVVMWAAQGRSHEVVVDGWAVIAAACHAGGSGLITGPGQTYD